MGGVHICTCPPLLPAIFAPFSTLLIKYCPTYLNYQFIPINISSSVQSFGLIFSSTLFLIKMYCNMIVKNNIYI